MIKEKAVSGFKVKNPYYGSEMLTCGGTPDMVKQWNLQNR
jgi:hypothetical protein